VTCSNKTGEKKNSICGKRNRGGKREKSKPVGGGGGFGGKKKRDRPTGSPAIEKKENEKGTPYLRLTGKKGGGG